MSQKNKTMYVLGRETGQMAVIRQLVQASGMLVAQPQHGWEDCSWDYAPELTFTPEEVGLSGALLADEAGYEETRQFKGFLPGDSASLVREVVFVECQPDQGWWRRMGIRVIDPDRRGLDMRPCILQVVEDLGNVMSDSTRRWVELVAADAISGIAGMLALGATKEEISQVRAFDRKARGIRPADERQVEKAIADSHDYGRLTVIRLENNWAVAVRDWLYCNADIDQLLVLTRNREAHFYGDGAICKGLFDAKLPYPQFQSGDGSFGVEGENSYWAARAQDGDDLTVFEGAIRKFILDHLAP